MIEKLDDVMTIQRKHWDPKEYNSPEQATTQEIIDKMNEIIDRVNGIPQMTYTGDEK